MSEARNSDAVNLDSLSPIGQSEPAIASPNLPAEAVTTATAQPEVAPVAQPADEVLHVELAAASAAPRGEPQADAVAQALAASESPLVADAQPAAIVAQELTAATTPATPLVEEVPSLPTLTALDVQPEVSPTRETTTAAEVGDLETGTAPAEHAEMLATPVIGLEALAVTETATPAIALASTDQVSDQVSDQVIAQAEVLPVAEVVAAVAVEPASSGQVVAAEGVFAQVIPVASDVVSSTPQAASAELFPDLAAPAPSAAQPSGSAGRFALIALIVLLLLAAGLIAFLMASGTNPLARFGL
jgi:hypothetical protein